ncbi:AfsR/SARP family transcriptional regulator [Citricoccus sp. CH26A]|uniref:AfsR/SARP family transcriptional regulator n=1 Tax=Citricoccus TaxID=169133 RepID=UPI0011460961|nr:BTAD domain-containing putative transcriptional regulator [Citricoccus sp. CH26A]
MEYLAADPAQQVAVVLLGRFQVSCDGKEVVLPVASQRLVALLSLSGRLSRLVAAGQMWPDVSEGQSLANLRTILWKLRRIHRGIVEVSGESLGLPAGVIVDVQASVAQALGIICEAQSLPTDALLAYNGVGEILPGWYDDWALSERDRHRELTLHALECAAHELLRRGLPGAAMDAALSAVHLEPLRESAHSAVIQVHLVEGNVALAMRHFDAFRRTMLTEVGVDPTRSFSDLIGGPCPVEASNQMALRPNTVRRSWQAETGR